MQDDFDGGAGIPDDELGGGPVETGEPMGMPDVEADIEGEGMPAAPAGRPSGGARRKSSGGGARKSGGAKAAKKSGGAKKKKPAKKAAKKAAKKKPAKKAKKKAGSKK